MAFPGSKPDQILTYIRRRTCELFISPFILFELDRILRENFRFTNKEADVRVNAIHAITHVIIPTERIIVVTANDDDNRIVECAAAAQAKLLVTGDKEHLLPIGSYHGTKIVTPAQCLDLLKYGG
ncbi:PIN domain-containing protein [Candidatus Methylomirabilis sp.]|uniref:PIN domain-containing protein n=1 Tax=Candidatus Methylomirabilis sp. TaxID=2032687 RepID=UPI003C70C2B0